MKSRITFGSVLTAILVSGCATPLHNYVARQAEISEPPVGSTNTAYVGDNLVRQGKFTEHDALYVESDMLVGAVGTYTIKKGFYLKDGEDATSAFFTPSRTDDGGAIIPGPLTDPPQSVQAYKKEKKL